MLCDDDDMLEFNDVIIEFDEDKSAKSKQNNKSAEPSQIMKID